MDNETLAAMIGVVKSIPGTAAARAETAASSAEASAELAAQHSMGVSINGTKLVFSQLEGE